MMLSLSLDSLMIFAQVHATVPYLDLLHRRSDG